MFIDLFSPAVRALQEELASGHHTELVKVLAVCEGVEERMSALATYCGIMVDDSFNQSKFDDLCDDCLEFLKAHRTPKTSPIVLLQ